MLLDPRLYVLVHMYSPRYGENCYTCNPVFYKKCFIQRLHSITCFLGCHQLHLSPKIRIPTESTQHGYDIATCTCIYNFNNALFRSYSINISLPLHCSAQYIHVPSLTPKLLLPCAYDDTMICSFITD